MIYIFSLIFLYIFSGLILFFLQRRILFNTSGTPNDPKYYGLEDVKEVKINTKDNISLLAWHFKGSKKSPRKR